MFSLILCKFHKWRRIKLGFTLPRPSLALPLITLRCSLLILPNMASAAFTAEQLSGSEYGETQHIAVEQTFAWLSPPITRQRAAGQMLNDRKRSPPASLASPPQPRFHVDECEASATPNVLRRCTEQEIGLPVLGECLACLKTTRASPLQHSFASVHLRIYAGMAAWRTTKPQIYQQEWRKGRRICWDVGVTKRRLFLSLNAHFRSIQLLFLTLTTFNSSF